MAKELEAFPQTRGRKAGESKYSYETWFDGKIYQLDTGDDFDIKVSSFRSSLLEAARKRKIKLRTAITNDGKSIVVQKIGVVE